MAQPLRSLAAGFFVCALLLSLQGCAAVAVASTAVGLTATAAGLAASAAVGTVTLVGKGVGHAAHALLDDTPDHSGLQVRYRDPAAAPGLRVQVPGAAADATPAAP